MFIECDWYVWFSTRRMFCVCMKFVGLFSWYFLIGISSTIMNERMNESNEWMKMIWMGDEWLWWWFVCMFVYLFLFISLIFGNILNHHNFCCCCSFCCCWHINQIYRFICKKYFKRNDVIVFLICVLWYDFPLEIWIGFSFGGGFSSLDCMEVLKNSQLN